MVPPGRTQLLIAAAALLLVVAAVGHELHLGRGAAGAGSTAQAGTSGGFGSRGGSAAGAGSGGTAGGATSGTGSGSGSGVGGGWSAGPAAGGPVVVDVGGAVARPGVYTLPGTSRVRDAIAKAGGAADGADLTAVNRAAHLVDGQQVVVPQRVVVATVASGGAGGGGPAGSSAGAGGAGATPAAPVSLNSGTAEQFDALDGVGPATAARIVADRTANGPFRTVDDLDRVPGIGPAKLEALRPHLTT